MRIHSLDKSLNEHFSSNSDKFDVEKFLEYS